jgi:dihydroflavonol-4-reductase
MTRALVTGANGFVGSAVVRELLRSGREVRCLVRAGSNLANLEGLPVKKLEGDVRDAKSVERAVTGCDEVYHVAASFRWGGRLADMVETNVGGTENVLLAAVRAGAKRIVHTSTAGTIGGSEDGTPLDERASWNLGGCGSPYIATKKRAEEFALQLARQKGAPVVIVNPSGPIGAGDVAPTATGKLVVQFLKRKLPARVRARLALVDVDDVARGHRLAAEKGRPGERYILSAHNLTIEQYFAALERVSGVPAPRRSVPPFLLWPVAAAGSVATALSARVEPPLTLPVYRLGKLAHWFDASKARKELGIEWTPLETAIEKAVKWFRERGYA